MNIYLRGGRIRFQPRNITLFNVGCSSQHEFKIRIQTKRIFELNGFMSQGLRISPLANTMYICVYDMEYFFMFLQLRHVYSRSMVYVASASVIIGKVFSYNFITKIYDAPRAPLFFSHSNRSVQTNRSEIIFMLCSEME